MPSVARFDASQPSALPACRPSITPNADAARTNRRTRDGRARRASLPAVAVTDPVDARLLAALAELGKAAVPELAAKRGMDPREVAYRLVALSGSGLPLLVGVESDPNGLRAALAGAWPRPAPPPPGPGQP